MKKWLIWLTAIVMLLGMTSAAYANEVPDTDAEGSITIELSYDGEAITDGTFAVYRVGEIEVDNGSYNFVLTKAYADYDGTLEDISASGLADELYAYTLEAGIEAYDEVENTDGEVVFAGLETGLYLVVQTVRSTGYESIAPYLVSVPQDNDGSYVYDVTCIGKFSLSVYTESENSSTIEEDDSDIEDDTTPVVTEETLPQTGQLNWPVPVLCLIGLILILAGLVLRGSRREEYAA